MIFLSVLILVTLLAYLAIEKGNLTKNSLPYYLGALAIGIVSTIYSFKEPAPGTALFFPVFIMKQGLIGMALFVIIMYVGALPNGKLVKTFMKARGELSILAVIFMLNHAVYYFVNMINAAPGWMSLAPKAMFLNIVTSVLSLWAWAICIPLFITSFKSVRSTMDAKRWKNLQRYAYLFYTLVYVHILCALLARPEWYKFIFTLIVYTVIFFVYAALRLHKAAGKKGISEGRVKLLNSAAVVSLMIMVAVVSTGSVLAHGAENDAKRKEKALAVAEKAAAGRTNGNAATNNYKDGTYEGTARGYKGDITVRVTLKDDKITAVEIVSCGDDPD